LDRNLQVRAGILSGEAAVTVGAEGQGMVAGDLVNTASRIQSAAEPGAVLVGESTKRASEAAVAYEDAGEHSLKGKAQQFPLARRVGNRYWEWSFVGFAYPLFVLGDWDAVIAREEGLPDEDWAQVRIAFGTLLTSIVPVRVHRGQLDEAKRTARLFAELEQSADLQEKSQVRLAEATLFLADGRHEEALRSAEGSFETRHALGIAYEAVREAFVVAVEAALALGDVQRAEQLLGLVDALPPGRSARFLQAHALRFRARFRVRDGDGDEADRLFGRAIELLRELDFPFYLAVALLEQGKTLITDAARDEAEPLLAEARQIFARLEARPWLERLDAVEADPRAEVPA